MSLWLSLVHRAFMVQYGSFATVDLHAELLTVELSFLGPTSFVYQLVSLESACSTLSLSVKTLVQRSGAPLISMALLRLQDYDYKKWNH